MEDPADTVPPAFTQTRVTQACARCRKQKLKCDTTRPCMLCRRSGVPCEPRVVSTGQSNRTGKKRQVTDNVPERKRSKTEPNACHIEHLSSVDNRRSFSGHQYLPDLVSQQRPPASPAAVFRSPDAASVSQASSATERQQQRFGANNSAVGFAANIFGDSATSQVVASDISSIPGHDKTRIPKRNPSHHVRSTWSLVSMSFPDRTIINALIDIYFERVNWFICIVHEPSLRRSKDRILCSQAWYREDMGTVLLCMAMSAMSLQCVARDPLWPGHSLLQQNALPPKDFADLLIKEIRYHLFDLVDDCCIETVQVCSLLGTYSIFHASPTLAWGILGLAVRTAYGISLHCDQDSDQEWDPVTAQIRRRNWLHLNVADIFSSMIYGRPISLDPAFSRVLPLQDLDDTILGPNLSGYPLLASTGRHPLLSSSSVTMLTFHVLKHQLYDIIHQALSKFRILRFQSPMSAEDMLSLIRTVQEMQKKVETWRSQIPPVFDCEPSIRQSILDELGGIPGLSADEERSRRQLLLQIQTLHITYDNAIIFIHRPLLEHRVPTDVLRKLPTSIPVTEPLHLAVDAALRMSQLPLDHFKEHAVMPFMLMNLFTAGVILCIPPSVWPLSSIAQDAKAGTLRIIKTSRVLKGVSPIALHTEQLLTRLLKICLEQEVENSLRQESSGSSRQSEEPGRPAEAPPGQDVLEEGRPGEPSAQFQQYSWVNTSSIPPHTSGLSRSNQAMEGDNRNMFPGPFQNHEYSQPDPTWSLFESEGQVQQVYAQMDETFGNFGQMLFNLVPNDPNSAWTWGNPA